MDNFIKMLDSAGFVLLYTPWWLSDLLYTVGSVLLFWYRLTRVVPDKGPLNGVFVCVWAHLVQCMCEKS